MGRNRYYKKDGTLRNKYRKPPRISIPDEITEANNKLMASLTDEWELCRTWTEFTDYLYVADRCYLYLRHKETGICKNDATNGCWYSDRGYVIEEDSKKTKDIKSLKFLLEITTNWWENFPDENRQALKEKLEERRLRLEEYHKKEEKRKAAEQKAKETINKLNGWEAVSTRFAKLLPEFNLHRKEYGSILCYCVGLNQTWVKIPVDGLIKTLINNAVTNNEEITEESIFKLFMHHLVDNKCYGPKKYNKRERKHLNQWKKIKEQLNDNS